MDGGHSIEVLLIVNSFTVNDGHLDPSTMVLLAGPSIEIYTGMLRTKNFFPLCHGPLVIGHLEHSCKKWGLDMGGLCQDA